RNTHCSGGHSDTAGNGNAPYATASNETPHGKKPTNGPPATHGNTNRDNHVLTNQKKILLPTSRQNRQPLLVLEMPPTRTTTIRSKLGNRLPSSHPPRTQQPRRKTMSTKTLNVTFFDYNHNMMTLMFGIEEYNRTKHLQAIIL